MVGDCVTVLRQFPDDTFHSVVTDPPYNLSDSRKRDRDCLSRVLFDVHLPTHL